ncbi:hypothetical protein [Phenylobacterium sp.]|uniref:hypothetical protein n=1 Tax=Phenylobacterium sp. TaxID=1871053 RepID=UPI002F92825A
MNSLAIELLIAGAMVVLTVVIHLVGLSAVVLSTGLHLRRFKTVLHLDRILVPCGMVLGVFAIHAVEIWAYALLYRFGGLSGTLEEALFISAGAYSTAGWGALPLGWRVVIALESVNGLILLGWSTAFLFQNLHRLMVAEEDHPLPAGAIARRRNAGR